MTEFGFVGELIVVPQADVAFVSRLSVVRSSWLSTEAFL